MPKSYILKPRPQTLATATDSKWPKLEDLSPMPYGAHVNKRMQDVPASYLLWMWNDGLRHVLNEDSKRGSVARYIKESMSALQKDDPDTIVLP